MFLKSNARLSLIHRIATDPFSWVLLFLLISRLFSMYVIPLNDRTEARYGEISRIMQETGNWVTLMHHYGEPFWAKPPLSTWLSAVSMQSFGVSPFAARLPALVLSIAILALIFGWVKQHSGFVVARLSVLVLASTLFFFLDAGTVMTDPALLFCTTLTLLSFWNGVVRRSRLWGYVWFISLGLGLLAKGPVALILPGMPIAIWLLCRRQWRAFWRELPWVGGLFLTLLIALPWYLLAESKTPGFLQYFIVGENFQRFIQPGWTGDKYGFAHKEPYGMIWAFALLGTLPWIIPIVAGLRTYVKQLPVLLKDDDGWMLFLLLSTLVPLVFFSFARNIIFSYVFPSLPTFAILFAEIAKRIETSHNRERTWALFGLFSGCLFLMASFLFLYKPELVEKSQYRVVTRFNQLKMSPDSQLIYWSDRLDYSALFYSKGHAMATINDSWLQEHFAKYPDDMLALKVGDGNQSHFLKNFHEVAIIPVLKSRYRLLRKNT